MEKKAFKPIKVKLEKDKFYYWCQCGASKSQPFCDGSHSGYFCEPIEIVVSETVEKNLCTCKKSAKKPYCDGTHRNL